MFVEDVRRTMTFYRDLLGFDVVVAGPSLDRPEWALLRRGTAEVLVQSRGAAGGLPLPAPGRGAPLSLYLDVDDVASLYERLRPRAPVVRELHAPYDGGRAFAVRDPDGVTVVFGEAEDGAVSAARAA